MPETIGDFLKARRAAIDPEQVGVVPYGRRRVPGLRREELAALAGVSPDYYTRVEQGRVKPSEDVVDAIARALELEDAERQYLHALARPAGGPRRRAPAVVGPSLRRLLETMDRVPAYVMGPRTEVVGFNALAEEIVFPFSTVPAEQRTMARIVFCEPFVRERHRDWDGMAAATVGFLRADVAADPDDPRLTALVGELTVQSKEFARLWSRQHVREKRSGHKLFFHPSVGDFELDFDTLALTQSPELRLVAFSAPAGSGGDTALRLLSTEMAATSG